MPDMFKDWDTVDSGLLVGSLLAIKQDIDSTHDFLSNSDMEEGNPLLGKEPSTNTVNLAGAVAGALTTGISGILEGPYRKAFLGAIIGLETHMAETNKAKMKGSSRKGLFEGGEGPAITKALFGAVIGAALDQLNTKDSKFDLWASDDEVKATYTKKF